MTGFADALLGWFDQHGRHDLPWQQDVTPYRVWISEIMLQQTQVTTVIPYYLRFMQRFPDVHALASADLDEVLHLWTGLGYYARARNLHKTAQRLCSDYDGVFPEHIEQLIALPGIGRSTAGAILSIAFQQRQPILDGNVKRVLTRYLAMDGWPGQKKVENTLWSHADTFTPDDRVADYTQAIMDLGATVCKRTRPDCEHCPLNSDCQAKALARQSDYPASKPKKNKPRKQTCFLILENESGEVLLEQRPPSGIWGGLWGFPECENEDEILFQLKQSGFKLINKRMLPLIEHTFSHFHLNIIPVHCAVKPKGIGVRESDHQCWVKQSELNRIGMAAPVKKIFDTLELMNDTNGELRKTG